MAGFFSTGVELQVTFFLLVLGHGIFFTFRPTRPLWCGRLSGEKVRLPSVGVRQSGGILCHSRVAAIWINVLGQELEAAQLGQVQEL